MKTLRLALAISLGLGLATPVVAVQPDEILADETLERRARAISREIRCPVCQSESIDDSDAPISRDLRLIIRERLVAGDSNDDVIDFVVARYGEFVLFNPRVAGVNWVLWLAGPAMLVLAGGIAFASQRRRGKGVKDVIALSDAEKKRLAELTKD